MSDVQVKGGVTVILWLSYMAMVFFALQALGVWVSIFAFVLMIPLIVAMGALWGLFNESDNSDDRMASTADMDKRKREQIDSVLRDLSDEDLAILRRRLQDGTIDDDVLHERMTLSDDGELIPMERNA